MAVNETKNTASGFNQVRPGQGYDYDSYLTYDEDPDPVSGNKRTYNTIGEVSVPTNVSKNSASPTNEAKS